MSRQNSSGVIQLYIMRHGEAQAHNADDRSRMLTERGRTEVASATAWLLDQYCLEGNIDLALVSPYQRARQTFDIVATDIDVKKCQISDDVIPDANPKMTHDYIDALLSSPRYESVSSVLIVSHMPLVSYLLDEVCSERTTSLFATASVAVVQYSKHTQKGDLLRHHQR